MSDVRVFLFLYLIETSLMVYVGLALFDSRLSRVRLISCGLILGFCVWVVRGVYSLLDIPLGSHTLVMTAAFIIVFVTVGHQSWNISVGATLAAMTLVVIGSGITQILLQVLGMTSQQILANPWLHILAGYGEAIFLVVVLFLNKVFGVTIVNILDAD